MRSSGYKGGRNSCQCSLLGDSSRLLPVTIYEIDDVKQMDPITVLEVAGPTSRCYQGCFLIAAEGEVVPPSRLACNISSLYLPHTLLPCTSVLPFCKDSSQ